MCVRRQATQYQSCTLPWITAVRRCVESEISHGLQVITQAPLLLVFKHIFGLQSVLVFTQRRQNAGTGERV